MKIQKIKEKQRDYCEYLRENFVPKIDENMKHKTMENIEKLNRYKKRKVEMEKKRLKNISKGKLFLEESTKIGREIKEIKQKNNESVLVNLKEEGMSNRSRKFGDTKNSNFYAENYDSHNKENRNNIKPKKAKKFSYTLKKVVHDDFDSSRQYSAARKKLIIGESVDLKGFSDSEAFDENKEEFVKYMQEKDRFIISDNTNGLINLKFKTEKGEPFRNKSEFIVDTIREKINFIKKISK